MAISKFHEVEIKFAVDGSTAVPDLTRLPEVESIGSTREHRLSAIYYDTRDLRLTRAKITLRRRTGGKDDGWHIKMPASQGRLELGAELTDPAKIPPEILSQVRAIVRDLPLEPIAQVDNNRREVTLLDDAGAPVAEFCDDRVTAWSLLPGGQKQTWREWEVELAGEMPGTKEGTELIRNATTHLISAGARVSASPSKLVAALGDTVDSAPLPPHLAGEPLDEEDPAYAVVEAIKANRNSLIEWDPKVRRDEWDSVHQMRVATRELRSQLETFEGVLEHEQMRHIENELKELARVLGVARDAEVVEERFHDLLDSDPTGLIDNTARAHIHDDMRKEYEAAHADIVRALDSDRYLALLDSIDHLIAHAASVRVDAAAAGAAAAAAGKADAADAAGTAEVLYSSLAEAYKKLMKRHRHVQENYDNPELPLHERENYVHDTRKTAKKLRYAAEAVGEASTLKTGKLAKACKTLQSQLGDFQDAVTARDRLHDLAQDAAERGEDTFAYGMLYQVEMTNAAAALDGYSDVIAEIKRAFDRIKNKKKKKR